VRITSAVHPLFGQQLQATGFKRLKGVLFLVAVLPDGSPGTIPLAATDIFGEQQASARATTLSVEGVRQLRAAVRSLQGRRSPSRSKTRK